MRHEKQDWHKVLLLVFSCRGDFLLSLSHTHTHTHTHTGSALKCVPCCVFDISVFMHTHTHTRVRPTVSVSECVFCVRWWVLISEHDAHPSSSSVPWSSLSSGCWGDIISIAAHCSPLVQVCSCQGSCRPRTVKAARRSHTGYFHRAMQLLWSFFIWTSPCFSLWFPLLSSLLCSGLEASATVLISQINPLSCEDSIGYCSFIRRHFMSWYFMLLDSWFIVCSFGLMCRNKKDVNDFLFMVKINNFS